MPTDADIAAWNARAKAQLRKDLVNKTWEQKLEASVRMRKRDGELRASRARMEQERRARSRSQIYAWEPDTRLQIRLNKVLASYIRDPRLDVSIPEKQVSVDFPRHLAEWIRNANVRVWGDSARLTVHRAA